MQTYQLPPNPVADRMQAALGTLSGTEYLALTPEQRRERERAATAIEAERWTALTSAERRDLLAFAEARVEQALAATDRPDIAFIREYYPLSGGYQVDEAIEELRVMILAGGYTDDELQADVSRIDLHAGDERAARADERAYQRGQDAWGARGGL